MTIARLVRARSRALLFCSLIGVAAITAACDAPDREEDPDELHDESAGPGLATVDHARAHAEVVPELGHVACGADHEHPPALRPEADGPRPDLDLTDAPTDPSVLLDPTVDYAALTAGATGVQSNGGQPSAIVLTGPSAFPLLIDENMRVFAAAARVGAGKVVAFGHEFYMNASVKTADNNKILQNAVAWAASKPAPVVGVESGLTGVVTLLTAAGYTVKTVTPAQLDGVNVYVGRTYPVYTEANYEAIRQFVAGGGGIIVGGQAWSFSPPPGGSMLDYSGNKMLRDSGIIITNSATVTAGADTVGASPPSVLLSARIAVEGLIKVLTNVANMSLADQDQALATLERDLALIPYAAKGFYDRAIVLGELAPTMTALQPFVPAGKPASRAAARVQSRLLIERPVAEITAHPLAADFPGAVDKLVPRVNLTVTIDGDYAGRDARYTSSGPAVPVWRSTGGYAAPGEPVKIKIPPAMASAGLTAQIGQHTDLLWKKTSWVRFPEITRTYPLTAAETTIASAFGGPVYIRVAGGKQLGPIDVTVENVVRAPLYVHGKTTQNEWLTIRDYPAPWAELGSDKMILMLPSSYIKNLADPIALLDLWDDIMDSQAEMGAIPYDRARPERYLIDRDISAGYMHSGYPIMASYTEAANLVSVASINAGAWGFAHELGHNHQWSGWFIPGTVDSSNNLFTVYTSEQVLGIPRALAHSATKPTARAQRLQSYRAGGKAFANWANDPWVGLEMYLQLQESFGWAPYPAVFGAIQALSVPQTPTTDQGRIDLFTLTMAQEVNKDLGPFFKLGWGIPVSQSVLNTMSALPAWNDHCPSAVTASPLGQAIGPQALTSDADVDWYFFDAPANAVGKKVRVVTSAGDVDTNTVVEVFQGECIGATSLGGPSDDANFHEDWLSTAITKPGRIYVKVSYSNGGYLGDLYNLTVNFQ